MRLELVIIGVLLVVLGAFLTFFPVLPSGSGTSGVVFQAKSLVAPSYNSVTWTNGTVNSYVEVVDCGTSQPSTISSSSATADQVCSGSGGTLITSGTGVSGSMAFQVPSGDWVVVASFSGPSGTLQLGTSYSGSASLGVVGFPLMIIGVVMMVAGAVLKSHKATARAEAARRAQAQQQAWPPYGQPYGEPFQQYPGQYPPGYYPQQPYYPPDQAYPPQDPYQPYPGPPYQPPY